MARSFPPRLFATAGVVLLAVVVAGSVLFGGFVVLANRQAGALPRPAGLAGYVKAENLDPSLLLRSLAGMPDRQVLGYVLSAGRNESAFAILAFGDSLSDPERANAALSLAQAFAAAGDNEKSSICYGLLARLAVLTNDFHDYQKANLLLQAGDGLAQLGRRAEAEEAYDRAQELARYSPVLQPSIRTQLLASLSAKYGALGLTAKAAEAARAASQPAAARADEPVAVALPAAPVSWQGDESWSRLKSLEMARFQATIELITVMEARPVGQTEVRRQALEAALLREDQAQEAYYLEQMRKAPTVSARLAVSRQRSSWLTVKWRVAARGYGISLAPDWEASLRDIEAALRRAMEDQYTYQLELASLLPDALQARQAVIDTLVEELKMSQFGLFPNAPDRGVAGDLTAAVGDRIALRDDGTLFVVAATRSGTAEIGFAFATADQLLRRGQ